MEDNQNQVVEETKETKKGYNAKKGLRFGMDVLITVSKILAIIIAVLAVIELISGIVLLAQNSSDTTGAQAIVLAICLAIYCLFMFYVISRFKKANYNFSIADVVFVMFISIPCAVLMIVDKGFEE